MYCDKEDAKRAVKELNNYEIRRGRLLGVCLSVDNCRLFVDGIPKDKTKEDIMTEMKIVTEGVNEVIVYPSATDKSKNRGFAFIEYENHRAAAVARRKMIPGRIQLWGYHVIVDWAEPEIEIDEDVMSKVKKLYVRNLSVFTTEETINEAFAHACGYFGDISLSECPVERVKKIKDYAFVHFNGRDMALKALDAMNGKEIDGAIVEVVLARPVEKMEYWRQARNRMGISQYELLLRQSQLSDPECREQKESEFLELCREIECRGNSRSESEDFGMSEAQRCEAIGPAGDAMFALQQGAIGRGGARAVGAKPPMFPMGMIRPGFPRFPTELLEEICVKNGLGIPEYILHSTLIREGTQDILLFHFRVSIPALIAAVSIPIQPNKLCSTLEEAKTLAAETALMHLGIPIPGPQLYPGDCLGMSHTGMPFATMPNMPNPPPLDLSFANSMIEMPPTQQGTSLYTGQLIMIAPPPVPYQNGYSSHPPPDLASITTSMSKLLSPTDMQDQCYSPPPQGAPPAYSSDPPTLTSMPSAYSSASPTLTSMPPAHSSASPTLTSMPPAHSSASPTLTSMPPAHSSASPTLTSMPSAYSSAPPTLTSMPWANSSAPQTLTSMPSAYSSASPTLTSMPPAHSSAPPTPSSMPSAYSSASPTLTSMPSTYSSASPTLTSMPSAYSSASRTLTDMPSAYSSTPPTPSSMPSAYSSASPTLTSMPSAYSSTPPTPTNMPSAYSSAPPTLTSMPSAHSSASPTLTSMPPAYYPD